MNHTSRSVLTATRKRKERGGMEDSSFYNKGSFGNVHKQQPPSAANKNSKTMSLSSSSSRPTDPVQVPVSSNQNQLLAGYMAHEFLTRGTLFGKKFDPARPEPVQVTAADHKRKPSQISSSGAGSEPEPKKEEPSRSYAEVAHLLKSDGVHIPGIVNPTQLARWIQM